jgi:hypothetical protein
MSPDAPPPGAMLVIWLIVLVAIGFILMMVYEGAKYLARRRAVMSSGDVWSDQDDDQIGDESPLLPEEINSETTETPQRVAEIRVESFTLGETTALARLVASGKLGLTDAVRIGADARSGERYQKRSREIKSVVEKLRDKYPQRTPDQDILRNELGLEKR